MAKSYTVSNDNGVQTFNINFSVIKESLKNKLRSEDLDNGSSIVLSILKNAELRRSIESGCINTDCPGKGENMRSMPIGPTEADYMFVDMKPSRIEAITGTTMTGRTGITLSMLLDKLGIGRNNIYFTSLCKCTSCANIDICMDKYFIRELDIVKPKVLICNGIDTLRKCFTSEIISLPTFVDIPNGGPYLPEPMECGMLYHVETKNDRDMLAIGINDINKILTLENEEYHKGKQELWEQLKLAFRDYVGGKYEQRI